MLEVPEVIDTLRKEPDFARVIFELAVFRFHDVPTISEPPGGTKAATASVIQDPFEKTFLIRIDFLPQETQHFLCHIVWLELAGL